MILGWCLAGPALGHGPLPERVEALTEELQGHPEDPDALLRRGTLRAQQGQHGAALADLELAHHLAPDRPDIGERLAATLLELDRPSEADSLLTRLLEASPERSHARYLRARARVALGRRTEAVRDFDEAIAGAGNPGPGVYLERFAAEDDPEARIAGLAEGVERLGPVVTLVEPAVRELLDAGDTDAARSWLEQLPASVAATPRWRIIEGRVHAAAGHHGEARAALRAALAGLDERPAGRRDTSAHRALRAEIERELAVLEPLPKLGYLGAIGVVVGGALLLLVRRALSPPG